MIPINSNENYIDIGINGTTTNEIQFKGYSSDASTELPNFFENSNPFYLDPDKTTYTKGSNNSILVKQLEPNSNGDDVVIFDIYPEIFQGEVFPEVRITIS